MDVDTLIVLFLVAQFKICVYVFWRLSKRLENIERRAKALKSAIMTLHQEEFKELNESLHRINLSMSDRGLRPLGLEVIDEEARKVEEELWLEKGKDVV